MSGWFFDIDRDEGWLIFGRERRWSIFIRYPTIHLYRRRIHPSQRRVQS